MEKLESLSKLKTDIEDIVKHQEQISKTSTQKEFIAAFGARMAEQFKGQDNKKSATIEQNENAPKISQIKVMDKNSKNSKTYAEATNSKTDEKSRSNVLTNTKTDIAVPAPAVTVSRTKKKPQHR